jgi:adenine-specific DNA-methyltransferase
MSQPTGQPILNAPTPDQQKLEILRQHFPQAIETDAQGHIRINAAALQLALDPSNPAGIQLEEDGYELRWVGKREAYHSAFVPVQKIISPLEGDSKNWDTTSNLLIKGDNLDALRLLRHSYFGKVKLIYIDPPYNTQSDAFIYRDDFSASQGAVLEQLGYSKDNIDYIKNIYGARTHSGWLSFMYPRLLLAKDLLRDDGVIFISIDDNEQAQLKLLCDEVFGQENFVAKLNILCNPKGRSQDKYFATNHEYAFAYSKSLLPKGFLSIEKDDDQIEDEYPEEDDGGKYRLLELRNTHREFGKHNRKDMFFPLYVNDDGEVSTSADEGAKILPVWEDGFEGCWTWGKPKAIAEVHLLTGKRIDGRWKVYRKSYANGAERMLKTILSDKSFFTERGQKEFNTLFRTKAKIFQSPKSPFFLQELLKTATSGNDNVLDFFAGSGTTAEAVMRLNAEDGGNRQFILVQIPQPIDPKKQKEAHQFVTEILGKPEATIFEITAERLRRAGAKIEAEQAEKAKAAGDLLPAATELLDTGFRVFELVEDPDALIVRKPLQQATQTDVAALQAAIATPQPEHLPRVLYNLLLSEGLALTTPIRTIKDQHLYLAGDVALVVKAIALTELTDTLRALKADGTPLNYLTVYAPWIDDSNFMLGINTVAESLGFSSDKLRLRG